MEWIRQWVLQIAGVIALGAICDIIMVDGEMKKYVKPILGFVLIFAIIRPIAAFSADKIRIEILQDSIGQTFELSRELDEKQKSDIVKIYGQKLGKKIEEGVNIKYNTDVTAYVTANKDENNFGMIQEVVLEVKIRDGEMINTESIKRYIKEEFGVENEKIKVTVREKG
ncbi:MAG: stage III sporulation protein AF [Clostridia bacterium]|nr:stage III sporulation protein AF [Clostridia bacterium]